MELVELGVVAAPSGVLVLATVGHLDYIWPSIGERLSDRAVAVAATGGGHIQEWLFEAVAVPVDADRPLSVLAACQPSPFSGEAAITMLEVRLGGERAGRLLGDLPADRCGMVLGDAVALDSWVGLSMEPHIDYDNFRRSAKNHPLHVGSVEVAGCPVLGIGWSEGDHSMRHRGERAAGHVYPVSVTSDHSSRTVLRWDVDPANVRPPTA
ncbi:hypothetical protein [Micromonospora musae]|uniref:Uncharacterized protein n=1 Tax=Micromonospora musae TaxID=1894970 RepID=A0A3A9YBZ0_9ACTN|nr:hypothetical protein [Micromonospora musae]RKN34770.1 hypothetical protein D7044_08165 [Micromonospora musae]